MAELTQDQKQEKRDLAYEFHRELFEKLGVSKYEFRLKMPYFERGGSGRHVVGIYPNEFKHVNGFYFEIVNRTLDPVDPDRKIYKLPFNADFATEYKINDFNSYNVLLEEIPVVDKSKILQEADLLLPGVIVYDPPLTPLIEPEKIPEKKRRGRPPVVKLTPPELNGNTSKIFPTGLEDEPIANMTMRDLVAIHTGKAVSPKPWLNELIKTISTNK